MVSLKMQEAIDFAYEIHKNQVDKAGRPYFGHVLRVAITVLPLGEKYFIAAILHDVVEDGGVSLQYIEEHWCKEIADAVESVSRRVNPTKEGYMDLIDRAGANLIGIEVKLADLEDNMQPSRIACLPLEMQSIVGRYERAKAKLLLLKKLRRDEQNRIDCEKAKLQAEQIYLNGGGA